MNTFTEQIERKNKSLIILLLCCTTLSGFIFAKAMPEYRPIQMYDFTRTVGIPYRPSLERDVVLQGSVSIASTLTLSGGQSGTINLQTSPDGVTYTTKQHCTNNNLGALIVGLNTNSVQDTQLGTIVPKGYWYKFVAIGNATMSTTVQLTETHF